jgi:hypothetical protein
MFVKGLKIPRLKERAGSIPAPGTKPLFTAIHKKLQFSLKAPYYLVSVVIPVHNCILLSIKRWPSRWPSNSFRGPLNDGLVNRVR